jgi:hypothetical protein
MIKLFVAAALLAGSAYAKKAERIMEWKGQQGGPAFAGAEVVVDANSWKRLWKTLGQDAPALDLKAYVAVAVFAGERMTGGYSIEFLEDTHSGPDMAVRYRIKPPSGFATQAITQPWKVKAFARVKGKVAVAPAQEKESKE